jgi:hypothetical protein
MIRIACVFLGLLLASGGCVEKEKHSSKADKELQKTIVLSAPPKPQHALDIQFGDKIKLLGYDLSKSSVREAETFTVTWYWHVVKPLDAGFRVFTHLMDAEKNNRLNLDSARAFREAYPEAQWKAGEYLRDVQDVAVPKGWKSKSATFCMGFWRDDTRLPITRGPKDDVNRALALTVEVVGSEAEAVPRLVARRATSPIKIDGRLDESDWSQTEVSPKFVNTMTGAAAAFEADVRVLYDADRLYLGYKVTDDYLKSTFEKDDDHLWEQDVVELMVDPDGDGKNYFEAQVAPTGRVFDTRYDSRRQPRPFGDMAWSSKMTTAVQLRGKVNDDGADEGYDVELAIPWSAFAAGGGSGEAPKALATWRMNFFVMDARDKGQRVAGWSPPLVGDFHTLGRFGRVVFPVAASGEPAPATGPAIVPANATEKPAATEKKK